MAFKILLVDDDAYLLQALSLVLQRGGYEVLTALSAESALALADQAQGRFDLLLTDWQLPDHDGAWLARKLHARYPSVKLAMISGIIDLEDLPPGPDPGIATMRKPIGNQELLDWVGMLLHA